MQVKVSVGGEFTEPFKVSSGLRQACILAPALFILLFSYLLRRAHQPMPDFSIKIRHKLDGKLFNISRLKTKSATTSTLDDFLYANDARLATRTHESLQNGATVLNNTCNEWGLKFSKPKTEVMHVQCEDPPDTTIDDFTLKKAHKFNYLGGDLTEDGNLEPQIKKRISRAAFTFRSLATRCFDRKGLSSNTKIAVYKAIILPTLLYGSETWPTLQHHIHMLEAYHQRSLRRLLKVKWWQHVTTTEVLKRAKCTTIETTIRINRLRWLRHVCRMDNNRIPKQLLFGEMAAVTRSR